MPSAKRDASSSALGYLYQVKWALLEVLRSEKPDREISLERLEDVAWEERGKPAELLQLKHHGGVSGTVGDMADDLWRTIAGWIDSGAANDVGPDLYLITTQTVADNSALMALRPPRRDLASAERRMASAAQTSQAVGTRLAREQFLGLTEGARARFISRIHVLDNAPRIEEIDGIVRLELRRVLPRSHEDTFLGLLWAWWYGIAIDMLQGRRRALSGTVVDAYISDLRDDFTRSALPTLIPLPSSTEVTAIAAEHASRVFVHQMQWVGAPEVILQKAIVDYYRAVMQTRNWVEDDLIGLHELERFEGRLRDEWEREFAWHTAELSEDTNEDEKSRIGRALLRSILDQTTVRVRERYDDPFFARGKYHELADNTLLGWHPDFEERLTSLLLGSSS